MSTGFGENPHAPRNEPAWDKGSRLRPWPDDVRHVEQLPIGRRAYVDQPTEDTARKRDQRRRDRIARRDPLCSSCGCVLSRYNEDPICAPCVRAACDHPAPFTQQV